MDLSTYKPANPGTDYPAKIEGLIDALSLATDKVDVGQIGFQFGYKRSTTAGLDVGYYGGIIPVDGALTTIADGTVALTNAATNYVERTAAGVVSKNTVGFSADKIPMFEAVTAGGAVTGVTDRRPSGMPPLGMLSKSVAAGGIITLTAAEARPPILVFTGVLPNNTTVELPAVKRGWIIYNNTTGAFSLAMKVTGQTGVSVTQGSRRMVYGDGVDIRDAQSDSAAAGFAAGVRLFFQQTTAPTGWTKETAAAYNDAALRITTGTVATVGTDAFSTHFGTGKTTAGHTLTITQIPSHQHGVNGASNLGDGVFIARSSNSAGVFGNVEPTGGGGAHEHTLNNFNVKYADSIIATKD